MINGCMRWNSLEPMDSMKIQINQTMDSKLKFSDRLKALLKTESRQDVDPYVFSEPEPMLSTRASEVKRNHQATIKSTGRGKCVKRKTKDATVGTSEPQDDLDPSDRTLELLTNPLRSKRDDQASQRRQGRDHTLLYYPRAGDEISDSESSGDELSIYQRHWFTGEITGSRSARLSQVRSQLRRRLVQLHKGGQESERLLRMRTQRLLETAARSQLTNRLRSAVISRSAVPLLAGGACGVDGCRQSSLPSTRHCSQHIMLNSDQLLFEHCTAKFSDNTQCCVPVFDVTHELPLCPEHARKRDNYNRKAQETKPKKTRKKSTSPSIPRPKSNKSRPKKRKRPPTIKPIEEKLVDCFEEHYGGEIIQDNLGNKTLNNINIVAQGTSNTNLNTLGLGLGSLGLGGGLKVELGDHEVFAALDPTEHDFGNVLNNLPADAFNDLFIESRNGEYEPSREEEEELERALEAVDKDVRNLERMGQTHGLLEPALLAQLMSDIAS
ncbi:INO80 complex subunit D [Fopius arisanus]|uniref:INO80 complex subunit D n=1 Tax=Fopius arisanus TaxID=64838 RepID=A0A9R1TCT9_9HYME|nr:PREDICTED: INO80 complex subunit D [Fopius arisanus]